MRPNSFNFPWMGPDLMFKKSQICIENGYGLIGWGLNFLITVDKKYKFPK